MKSDVGKCFILASTIRNRANLSCAYVMWWRIKIIYPCKIPCEMYIRIFIAERLSVTWILSFSFFLKSFSPFFLFFLTRNDIIVQLSPPGFPPRVCLFVCLSVCFSFRSVYQHRLARRNVLRSSHNSRLEMLGMYGVTWFFFFSSKNHTSVQNQSE